MVYFPECFVPGYRWRDTTLLPPDAGFLERTRAEVPLSAFVLPGAVRVSRMEPSFVLRPSDPSPARITAQNRTDGLRWFLARIVLSYAVLEEAPRTRCGDARDPIASFVLRQYEPHGRSTIES